MFRNDPKSFCSDFYRTRFYILMVAQPIQDLSKVPIAHETLGGCLPRLRRSEPVTNNSTALLLTAPHPTRSCSRRHMGGRTHKHHIPPPRMSGFRRLQSYIAIRPVVMLPVSNGHEYYVPSSSGPRVGCRHVPSRTVAANPHT